MTSVKKTFHTTKRKPRTLQNKLFHHKNFPKLESEDTKRSKQKERAVKYQTCQQNITFTTVKIGWDVFSEKARQEHLSAS